MAIAVILLGSCKEKEKYNLVFIMAENYVDAPWSKSIESDTTFRKINTLLNKSVQFTNAYQNTTQSGPYQGMILSGQHPLYNGAFAEGLTLIPSPGKRIGGVLQKEGYKTGFFGEWNLGNNNGMWKEADLGRFYGFEEFHQTEEMGARSNTYKDKVRDASEFIEKSTLLNSPFAVFLSIPNPYSKIDSTQNSENSSVLLYQNDIYFAIKELVSSLNKEEMYDQTIIIFTSSVLANSFNPYVDVPNTTFSKVPLFIKLPGDAVSEKQSTQLLSTLDIMPTTLGLLGMKVPGIVHGRDLSSTILDKEVYMTASVPLFQFYPFGYRGLSNETNLFLMEVDSGNETGVLYKNQLTSKTPFNYYYEQAYSGLKKELQDKAMQWMQYYEDEGYTANDITEVKSYQDWKALTQENGNYLRPIDELKKLHGNRIMNFHGNNSYE